MKFFTNLLTSAHLKKGALLTITLTLFALITEDVSARGRGGGSRGGGRPSGGFSRGGGSVRQSSRAPSRPTSRPAPRPVSRPMTRPSVPASRPSTRPSRPTTRPSVPTTRPSVPTTRPNIPTTRPNVPSTRPNIPNTRPNVPSGRRPVTGDRKINVGDRNLNINIDRSRNIVAGNRHTGWRGGYHHYPNHHAYYHHRYNHWNDYWKWRAISGAIALGVYAISQPPYYAPVYYNDTTYYYADGVYYRRQGSRYVIVPAPVGAIVSSPPPTYETVVMQKPAPAPESNDVTGGKEIAENGSVTNNYYFANGTFYEDTIDPASLPTEEQRAAEQKAAAAAAENVNDEDRKGAVAYAEDEAFEGMEPGELKDEAPEENFRIVAPPMGATVSMLPEDAEEKKIGETTYFVYAGTWYKPFYSGEDVVYMVSSNPEEKAGAKG